MPSFSPLSHEFLFLFCPKKRLQKFSEFIDVIVGKLFEINEEWENIKYKAAACFCGLSSKQLVNKESTVWGPMFVLVRAAQSFLQSGGE